MFQLDMCRQLYLYHTESLEDEEALWAFSPAGLQVRKQETGWRADWPETESYTLGPASIAWTLWHIIYWWSTALDHNFGKGTLRKEDIPWPGTVESAKAAISALHEEWVARLNSLSEADYLSEQYSIWPLPGRSFSDTALWLNGEFMKNTAEIGYGRFLYASRAK